MFANFWDAISSSFPTLELSKCSAKLILSKLLVQNLHFFCRNLLTLLQSANHLFKLKSTQKQNCVTFTRTRYLIQIERHVKSLKRVTIFERQSNLFVIIFCYSSWISRENCKLGAPRSIKLRKHFSKMFFFNF